MNHDQPIAQPAALSCTRPRWAIPALLGALVLAAALAFGVWRVVGATGADATQYHAPRPPVALPALYYETAREQLAEGLGLSVAQVAAEVRANPDQGIFGVAEALGISPDQLHTLEINALRAAGARLVAAGQWTPREAGATLAYWQARDAKSLGADLTAWFQSQ